MAGEKIEIKVGNVLTIKDVREGTKQDGTPWMQIHVVDESGKIEGGAFLDPPIPNLREGDRLQVDGMSIILKRSPNRYAYNAKTWEKLPNPIKFITEPSPQITAHVADGGSFGGGGFGDGGFGEGGFDTSGELPF